MERHGYRLHLTNIAPGTWRAAFSQRRESAAEGFAAARRAVGPTLKRVIWVDGRAGCDLCVIYARRWVDGRSQSYLRLRRFECGFDADVECPAR
jgi:hypothetical protein